MGKRNLGNFGFGVVNTVGIQQLLGSRGIVIAIGQKIFLMDSTAAVSVVIPTNTIGTAVTHASIS